MSDPRQDIIDALHLLDHPNATAEEIAIVVLGALPTVEQLTHRLADARRAEQVTAQLLDEARAELSRTRPMADAGHTWAATRDAVKRGEAGYGEYVRARIALPAAHRATTPSPPSATHVVVEVAELERLRDEVEYLRSELEAWTGSRPQPTGEGTP